MNLKHLLHLGLVKDDTELFVQNETMHVLAHGNWYQDDVLEYIHHEVESFIWQDDNKIYIDIRG